LALSTFDLIIFDREGILVDSEGLGGVRCAPMRVAHERPIKARRIAERFFPAANGLGVAPLPGRVIEESPCGIAAGSHDPDRGILAEPSAASIIESFAGSVREAEGV
jgi:hypothetical protein